MIVDLEHPFKLRCIDPIALLQGCYKLNTFISRVEKQAKRYGDGEDVDKYKGWALELFAEFLIKSHPMDKRLGISDYEVVGEDDDTGVDGYGKGSNGEPATVQIKYRPANYVLAGHEDHLFSFTTASWLKYGVKNDGAKNMLLITTGKDLHWHTDQNMFQKTVRVLNREKL